MMGNKAIAIACVTNRFGRKDGDEFGREARAFIRHVGGGAYWPFEAAHNQADLREDVLAKLRGLIEFETECVAFFCHGWATGIQAGFGMKDVDRLAEVLSTGGAISSVVLYCCSAGKPGGFADALSSALAARSPGSSVLVYAHTTKGHTTKNPRVIRYDRMGAEDWSAPVVDDGSIYPQRWRAWRALLQTPFRFEFPFLSAVEIDEKINAHTKI